ncbi:MAG: hypothetical protein EOM05_12715 [Clostridia bacterium]|nr:hypothetical protein [Clostridia bacterium]
MSCLAALISSSVYGIFFANEHSGTGITLSSVIDEINSDYNKKLEEIKSSNTFDVLEISGGKAVWENVLSVYAIKINTDINNPQEVATINEDKKQLLKNIFWEMNSITS